MNDAGNHAFATVTYNPAFRTRQQERKGKVQLTRESAEANVIHAWESGRMRVGNRWLTGHVIVAPDRIVPDWNVGDAAGIAYEHLAPAIDLDPEIILLGTGPEAAVPDVGLIASLAQLSIGLEIMSTPAACRTYNVLVSEQRRVVAALLNPAPHQP